MKKVKWSTLNSNEILNSLEIGDTIELDDSTRRTFYRQGDFSIVALTNGFLRTGNISYIEKYDSITNLRQIVYLDPEEIEIIAGLAKTGAGNGG